MRRKWWLGGAALTLAMSAGTAWACADAGCEGGFSLIGSSQSCQGMAMLAPGNDSRINLMLLLADKGNRPMSSLKQSEANYSYVNQPTVFVDWATLRGAYFPEAASAAGDAAPAYSGTRCQSYQQGGEALLAAMTANRSLPAGERSALIAARGAAEEVCKQATAYSRRYGNEKGTALPVFASWPVVSSAAGKEFLGYIQAADAFYGERWDEARQGFSALSASGDPFVRETASYMLVRVEFGAAQTAAYDEYGFYDGNAKVDQAAVKRGLQALSAYLKAWPSGRYAASAQGLVRRGLWLSRNYGLLGSAYARMLDRASANEEASAELVEEIDTKLLFNPDAEAAGVEGAMLLAAKDLVAMRDQSYGEGQPKFALSAAELDAQASRFAGQGELFTYLQATHAFYYGRDFRRVLQLIPDNAKQPAYSNLAFSRQVLRGMALAELKDRNEAGFWQDLLGGAKGPWQRPLAELGLAMNWERSGKLASVFAPGSPVSNGEIRSRLIDRSAGPALLRTIVTNKAGSAEERDQALYTLLANELVMGQYTAFGTDVKLPVADRKSTAAIFTSGKVSDGYPCAPLAVTASALARNPQDVPGRLCLGDFLRLQGLDYLHGKYDVVPQKNELGGYAVGFPGKRNFRDDFYAAIANDPRAAPNDKAYALYRAVMCYAPSGNNDCGGADVPKSQRKVWFERLKRDYPQSTWAKKLRYYW
ncbi:hypothetical protein [Novosphingobium sp.]|uniref:hypothetical protein n=1 Tax=Novosphingobium sp. TaxID=1874826 RepID=UPI002C580C25|nr:hypothetical protein [Novosphingobium sp.]HQV04817.1 hypothetical protein [Novosphingobium sp.]